MSEFRQFALAAYFLQLSRIAWQVVFVYCKYRSFSESMKCLEVKPDGGGMGASPHT